MLKLFINFMVFKISPSNFLQNQFVGALVKKVV